MEQILVSKDNCINILKGFVNNLYNKINNKDLSIPYIEQFTKAGILKTDGNGDMFLCNNGEYIKIDLNSIEDVNSKIQTIYDLFKIEYKKYESWSTGTPMLTSKQLLTSQIYNNKIYCIGGTNASDVTNIVEIYDIDTDIWSIGNPMLTARYNLTSQIYNSKIYCIGGDKKETLNTVEIYDIENNTWSTGTDIPTGRYGLTSQIYKNKVYCIGGYNKTYLNNNDILSLPYSNYDIKLPEELDNKLNIIKSNGFGNKLLADNGIYIDPSNNYTVIQDNEISDLVNQICTKEV